MFQAFTAHAVVMPPDVELAFRVGGVDESAPVQFTFDHMCPKCVSTKAPLSSLYGRGFTPLKEIAAHDCGLPNVLPASNASVFAYLVKSGCTLHTEPVKSVKILTSNKTIMKELKPLSDMFAASWFEVCQKISNSAVSTHAYS